MLGRILVVDDNAMVRESYTELLRHRGYDVMQAGDGEEALKVIRTSSIDLAIIDVMMPVMGGLELRQVLQDKAPGIATILVTGQPDKVEDLVDDDPDFQTGRVAMLYKPVHPVMLLAEVDKRLMKVMGMR
ncbi:MAG: response regulator [Rhodospirillaceae bacterium]|nr:response regulator [Rhodospirillaceae bacterium]